MKTKENKTRFLSLAKLDNLEMLVAENIVTSSSRHTHETLTLGVIEKGTALLHHKGTSYPISSGSIILINPDDVHACYPEILLSGYSQRIMYPSIAIVEQATYEITGKAQQLPLFREPIIHEPKILRQIQKLFSVMETASTVLEQETHLMQTLIYLISTQASCSQIRSVDDEPKIVSQIREYLDANYIENPTLTQLADLTYISPFHLSRIFSQSVGLPPHLYLIQVRVLQAKKLLSQGLAIAQVAQEVGFSHQSHLNRHFKKIVGVTPKQYQNSKNVQD